MMKIMDSIKIFKDSNEMVSEIVGTVLILGITIAIISMLYTVVLAYPAPGDSTFVDLVGTVEGDNIIIEHRGGDALGFGTKVIITIDDETDKFTIGEEDYLDPKAKMDNRWNVGESLEYKFNYSLNYSEAEITVIDEYNTIVLKGILDISPGCDIGVMIECDEGSAPDLSVSAMNYRSDIDTVVDVSIEITLPEGLSCLHFNEPSGTTYNSLTGIWYIESFPIGGHITLGMNIMGEFQDVPAKVELLSSTPMDINPDNNIDFTS